MSRYEYNPAASQATFEVFPKGDYEVILGKPKSFAAKNQDGSVKNYGLRVPFTVADGEFAGKKGIANLYLHNEGSQAMTKRFQMAVMGYSGNTTGEQEFNMATINKDWSFDPDTGAVSSDWGELEGSRVIAVMDVQPSQAGDGTMQQQIKGWRPLSSKMVG